MVQNIDGKETMFGQEILQLKINKVPKGLVVLESVFYSKDRVHLEFKDKKP